MSGFTETYETTASYTFQELEQYSGSTIIVKYDGTNAVQKTYNKQTDAEYLYRSQKLDKTKNIYLITAITSSSLFAIL